MRARRTNDSFDKFSPRGLFLGSGGGRLFDDGTFIGIVDLHDKLINCKAFIGLTF